MIKTNKLNCKNKQKQQQQKNLLKIVDVHKDLNGQHVMFKRHISNRRGNWSQDRIELFTGLTIQSVHVTILCTSERTTAAAVICLVHWICTHKGFHHSSSVYSCSYFYWTWSFSMSFSSFSLSSISSRSPVTSSIVFLSSSTAKVFR